MKIHYFQRYHAKENVATANTMLLLSRFYSYSADKFFRFLKSRFFSDSFEPELVFTLQEKNVESVPDATITQEGFKIVVETKLYDPFYLNQLERHLRSFGDEKYKVLVTLAPEIMPTEKLSDFEKKLSEYNKTQKHKVVHVNTTFEDLAQAIQEAIDERDHEMQDVLEDYLNYCYNDGLITVSNAWKYLCVRAAGTTFDFNIREGVYYDKAERGFRAHDYIGLYKNKSVRYIGKVVAIITAVEADDGKIAYDAEFGKLTEERKEKIQRAITDGENYGYELGMVKHRYFFADSLYETDFKKITSGGLMSRRYFDLTTLWERDDLPNTEEIAKRRKDLTWG